MREDLRELWRFRELFISVVQREIKIRYKNSALGFLWSFINPLVTTAVMTLVFGTVLSNGIPNYSAYVLAAYLPYMFFQFSVLDSAQSVLGSIQLVKKIYFPREVLPLAAVASNFIHLLLGYVVFFLFLLTVYLRDRTVIPFQITTLFLPLLLLINLMLAVGVSLIVSALNTLYEDVKYIVGVLMYLLFFLCPIMYFAEEVANSRSNIQSHYLIYKLYNLNPIAVLTTAYRKILLAPIKVPIRNPDGKPLDADTLPMAWDYVAYSFVLSFLIMVGGYALFNRMKWRFVERP